MSLECTSDGMWKREVRDCCWLFSVMCDIVNIQWRRVTVV